MGDEVARVPPSTQVLPTTGAAALGGVGFLLGATHRARRRRWEAALSDLGISAPQSALLRLVVAAPGHGVREISRRLGTDPMNAQRIVESLLVAGLCESRGDPHDARRKPLYPTPAGTKLAGAVTERAERSEAELAGFLGPRRYQALIATLEVVLHHDSTEPAGIPEAGPGAKRPPA